MSEDLWSKDSANQQRCAAIVRSWKRPCCICGERIDYGLRWPNPRSFSVQHLIPRKLRPDLTFDVLNMDAAHLDCNQSHGDRLTVTERVTSRRW